MVASEVRPAECSVVESKCVAIFALLRKHATLWSAMLALLMIQSAVLPTLEAKQADGYCFFAD